MNIERLSTLILGVHNIGTISTYYPIDKLMLYFQKRDVKDLVDDLLDELYSEQRDWAGHSGIDCSHV